MNKKHLSRLIEAMIEKTMASHIQEPLPPEIPKPPPPPQRPVPTVYDEKDCEEEEKERDYRLDQTSIMADMEKLRKTLWKEMAKKKI